MKINEFLKEKYLTVGSMDEGDIGYDVPWSLMRDSDGWFISGSSSISSNHIGGTTNTMIIAMKNGKIVVDVSGCRLDKHPSMVEKSMRSDIVVEVDKIFYDRFDFVEFLRQ